MQTIIRRYDPVAVFLHWTIGLLIILMLGGGFLMEDLPISIKFTVYNLHKSIGITIIALSIFRLVWRLLNPPPALPDRLPVWQKFASHAAHWALYAFMIAMPLSGWLMVSALPKYPIVFFGLGEAPFLPMPELADAKAVSAQLGEIHETLALGGVALILLHIGAALQHHFILRDGILRRMLPQVFSK
jgi:cytochrome b561